MSLNTNAARVVLLGGISVGAGQPVLVVAEAGVNHDGDLNTALALVDAARDAGAGAIKFQTFVPAALAVPNAPLAGYQRATLKNAGEQRAMLERLCLSRGDWDAIARRCEQRGILLLSTPFDLSSAELLEKLGVPAFKLASGDLTNLSFLQALSVRGRPLLVSTGMSSLGEVARAVDVVRRAGAPLVLLHCVSSYPTPYEQANLRAIDTLRSSFDVPVGYSDHCLGLDASLAAVARDACVIERHLTLDRGRPGPDHAMSLEPDELRELIRRIRSLETMLGDGVKRPQTAELETRAVARRSIVAARALAAGETLGTDALALKRPGTGLDPARLPELLGTRLVRPLAADEQLTEAHLEARA